MTQAGRVLGTAAYMSPEQIRGQTVDTRSDVFAFGLVMYEMATGVSPFQGATSMDVMSAILHKKTSPPSQLNAEVPPELERIIGKCLENDQAERYQDTRDLVVDLRRLKKDTDSGAASRAPVTGEREVIRPARRRALVTVLLVVGIAAVVLAAGFLALRFRPRAPKAGTLTQRLLLSTEEVGEQSSGSPSYLVADPRSCRERARSKSQIWTGNGQKCCCQTYGLSQPTAKSAPSAGYPTAGSCIRSPSLHRETTT
jgi:serine/threonine protein kinase